MNFRLHSLLYFTTGIVFIALETWGLFLPGIAVKAIIIPLLVWMYLRFVRGEWNRFHRMILFALVFSWIGDVTLQLAVLREDFFLLGLASFMVTQLLYTVAFFSTCGPGVLARRLYLLVPVAAYGGGILWLLWGGLGDMTVPVTVYTVVILTMLVAAINRREKVNPQSYRLVLAGAILFILSDSMIAINKFHQPFELARVAIMGSYITAQFLIAVGCVRQFNLVLKN